MISMKNEKATGSVLVISGQFFILRYFHVSLVAVQTIFAKKKKKAVPK